MKWNALRRWLGVGLSSLASIFAGHQLHATPVTTGEVKPKPRNGKDPERNGNGSGGTFAGFSLFPLSNAGKTARQYPWRYSIVTTTFWVGEQPTENNPVPNHKSCWDPQWARNYGGTDTPKKSARTPSYTPAAFTPRQNPFYIALPYNDVTSQGLKPETSSVIPWFSEEYKGPKDSVCKGRWIAIRFKDRVCYAQWEDAGPFRTDHWQYVFGTERPKPNLNKGAGLDVSPAVRDFLGMNDTDVTDWKFVEFADVPQGPWAAFGDNNTFVQNRRAQLQREAAVSAEPGKSRAKAAVE